MILAGIDEAGYGPVLGPLVVGCCAFEVDAAAGDVCLWKRLSKCVSKSRPRSDRKIHVNDSKRVYSPGTGLRELERSVLALAAAWHDWSEDLEELLRRVSPHAIPELAEHRWYGSRSDERFPLEQEGIAVKLMANALRKEMERTGTRCVHLAARVVGEKQLNRMLANTRNKSNALFSISAIHLDHLLRTYGRQGLMIYCDRQGGRERYGHLLRLMFEEWSLEVIRESEGHSEYRMVKGADAVRMVFCEKAEGQCMPVAVASMLCKYLREALMRRFNGWWREHLPELKETAGYYTDGMRFLMDIQAKRTELGIGDAELIRSR